MNHVDERRAHRQLLEEAAIKYAAGDREKAIEMFMAVSFGPISEDIQGIMHQEAVAALDQLVKDWGGGT